MAYQLPQLIVRQRFAITPIAAVNPRSACITGPHAQLFRYNVDDEKLLISLGESDFTSDEVYSWPNKPVGATVDTDYVKLFLEEARLRYFRRASGGSGTAGMVTDYPNRVRISSYALADNGASFPAHASLGDRGVKVGDLVKVRGADGELEATVRSLIADVVAGSLGSLSKGSNNAATQSAVAQVQNIGDDNAISVMVDGTAYDGLASGYISEEYTVEVTTPSTGGDMTTALLKITSLSGTDDQDDVSPAAVNTYFDIGTRGGQIKFTDTPGSSVSSEAVEDDIPPRDLSIGQKWRVVFKQAFTNPTPVRAGTYTGDTDTTYIATITTGGAIGTAQFTVTTTNGFDYGDPITIAAHTTAYALGSYGATISFTNNPLRKGDKYYIPATAPSEGYLKTVELSDDLPSDIRSDTDLEVSFYMVKNLELTKNRLPDPPNTNWTATESQFTVNDSPTVFDSEWTVDDEEVAIPIEQANLFVEYRAWLTTYVGTYDSLSDPAEAADMLGTIHPDNPLGYGVWLAAQNGSNLVYFNAVADPDDTTEWTDALSFWVGAKNVYTMVPLTDDPAIHDLWLGHCVSESADEVKRWRRCAVAPTVDRNKVIVNDTTTDDEETAMATLDDDPTVSGTSYSLLTVTSGNALFITNNVRAGDTVRYLFDVDGFGDETYTEFVVEEVVSENTLRLTTGHTEEVDLAQRVEVWRFLKRTDLAAEIADKVGVYGNRRAIAIANSVVLAGGATVPAYFAAAAYAGMRGGVNPHQPLTRADVIGIQGAGSIIDGLNADQLNTIAAAGGLIMFQPEAGASIQIRHAITTSTLSLNEQDEMFGSNFDSVSYSLASVLEPFIGRANVVPDTISLVRSALAGQITELQTVTYSALGPQVLDSEDTVIVDVRRHSVLRDQIVAQVRLDLPYALNVIDLTLETA
jgi:hypothetical protein